ncbi:MAG: methyltransferase domain-containing protein [Candidatus Methylomirabilia bacterium]
MAAPAALPRAVGVSEFLDAPVPLRELEENLRDLGRLNRLFGGSWLVCAQLGRLVKEIPADQPVTILDVGTGGADLPMALVRWARRRGRRIRVLALDRSDQVLAVARRLAAEYPEIAFVQGDGLSLPVAGEAVDVALASLTLHHLEPTDGSVLLSELDRVGRGGFVVNDLMRSRVAYSLVWFATRLFTRSQAARHDGPLSVLRAYTPDEIQDLARRAGLSRISILRYSWLCRLAAVRRKG